MILGIETATPLLSVALVHDTHIHGSIVIDRPNAHDELLAPLCRDLLHYCGVSTRELDGIAVSSGPGSFTGLRIGMAVAKGMAFALRIPLASIPTMDAIAFGMAQRRTETTPLQTVVLLPARKEELYMGTYVLENGSSRCTTGPEVLPLVDVVARINDTMLCGGNGSEAIRQHLQDPFRSILPDTLADARHVALLGAERIDAGETADAASCEPLYVQDFEVKQTKHVLQRP